MDRERVAAAMEERARYHEELAARWRALRTTLCVPNPSVASPWPNSALWHGWPLAYGGGTGRWGMAMIDDARARLVAGQAARLRDDARLADELLQRGRIEEARELVARNAGYANAIWHELDLVTRPVPPIPIRGTSRRR